MSVKRTARSLALLSRLLRFQNGCCYYCGRFLPEDAASVDHLIPRSCGGDGFDNLVACCRPINFFFGCSPLEVKQRARADTGFIQAISRWCLVIDSCMSSHYGVSDSSGDGD